MKKMTVSLPNELAAKAAHLNLSATLRAALRERLDPQGGPVATAVDRLFSSLDAVSFVDLANGELALALARKLDGARWSDSASMALASASVARELRAVIDEVAPNVPKHDALDALLERRQQRLSGLSK